MHALTFLSMDIIHKPQSHVPPAKVQLMILSIKGIQDLLESWPQSGKSSFERRPIVPQ